MTLRSLATPLAALAVVALGSGCGGHAEAAASGRVRTIVLEVRHSRFSPAAISVPAGQRVRFVVRNLDPIDHELIVGPAAVHRRHETGTEGSHSGRDGEVSVPAGAEAATSYTFASPGTVTFACHLPGHLAYGMEGTVTVTV